MSRTLGDVLDDKADPMCCSEDDLVEIERALAYGYHLNNTGVRDLIFTIRQLRNASRVLDGRAHDGRGEG